MIFLFDGQTWWCSGVSLGFAHKIIPGSLGRPYGIQGYNPYGLHLLASPVPSVLVLKPLLRQFLKKQIQFQTVTLPGEITNCGRMSVSCFLSGKAKTMVKDPFYFTLFLSPPINHQGVKQIHYWSEDSISFSFIPFTQHLTFQFRSCSAMSKGHMPWI